MVIAAVVYISVTVLLIFAAAFLFAKALRSLRSQAIAKPNRKEVLAANPINKSGELSGDLLKRQEIIESLERQFRSSPSADF
jgi:hypothetical protein